MRVAIIDSGIDLQKLYRGERHAYVATWVRIEQMTYSDIAACDIVVIPAGSDNSLLAAKGDCLRAFLRRGGWVFSFDGLGDGIFDGLRWVHTVANRKTQSFHVPDTAYSFLLDGVPLEGLACKDGVRGWWCEGELSGDQFVPLLVDECGRVVAALLPPRHGSGGLVATAAARLPLFSADPSLAANILFSNLLSYVQTQRRERTKPVTHVFVHSGNWAHRSFLKSGEFATKFTGVHWSCLDDAILDGACSIWIPWESNTRALKDRWQLLERAVKQGATLVIEDLREDWLPGVTWYARPVDSSWWRENRRLDLTAEPAVAHIFQNLPPRAFFWHYHGVFDGPSDGIPLLKTADGKHVLSVCGPTADRQGRLLVSTLDATFEYGVGKIRETGDYIRAVMELAMRSGEVNKECDMEEAQPLCRE